MKKVVSKEIHKKLPKSGGPSIRWSNFWCKWWWESVRPGGKSSWRPMFYLVMRMANAYSIHLGPIVITWPARWLEAPARHSYPEVFE